ncbi:MAG: DNA-processing protein DprA [Gemmatimonadetes bacterium]|nr:DNA-processing protein DprA [Gemmatimonadota bacterium]
MAPLIRRRAPSPELLELLVRALALPGAAPASLAAAAKARGGAAAGARAMIAAKAATLTAAERDRWTGWAERSMTAVRDGRVRALVRGFDGYPARLLDLDVPPPVLFAVGDLDLLDAPAVAVVGTRKCTPDAILAAERIAGDLAAAGAVVVSGLALGIDAAAHRAAGPPRTIGVLGCGVDVLYPRSNARLQKAIGREGLLLSERLPGTPPYPYLFPERNRIIAALARAVAVVQAPPRSGALITADQAHGLGRPVFAVPGSLAEPRYEGSNARIRDRLAVLVTGAEEVLKAIGLDVPSDLGDRPPAALEGVGLALWRAVGPGPAHADDLAEAVGLEPSQGLASLLALEVQGHLRQLPGMRFVRSRTTAGSGG